jgi:hypothetical protein
VYVVVLVKPQKKSDLRIADLASSEEDRKKVCRLPEAVSGMGYPRFESKVHLFDGQEFAWMVHISKPFSKRNQGTGEPFMCARDLVGVLWCPRRGKHKKGDTKG